MVVYKFYLNNINYTIAQKHKPNIIYNYIQTFLKSFTIKFSLVFNLKDSLYFILF